jgi:HSP20 family protein
MSTVVRWEPIHDAVTLRDAMDRLFEDSFVRPRSYGTASASIELPVDMYETEDDLVVSASVPGVKPEDIEITIVGDALTIKGATKSEFEVERANVHRQERRYGAFTRSLAIPVAIQTDKAEAKFRDGVLTLVLPKADAIKPKTIKVKS